MSPSISQGDTIATGHDAAPGDAKSTTRLRVLFLVSRDIRHPSNTGGDIGLWERALYLASEGHQVTVMATSFPGASPHETIDGIKVDRMGGLLSMWWRTYVYYMTKCRGRFDVVVVEGFGGSRIPRLTPLYVTEPIITEWHQIHSALFAVQYPKVLGPALNLLERITAFVHRNTIVMARTDEWKAAFPQIGFKTENIRVVPACISENWLARDRPQTNPGPQIVWLGKFRRYKCPDHAIRAMTEVVRSEPTARLILAGHHDDLGYEAELSRLVGQLGLGASVEFRFEITDEEKKALLDTSRCLVLPSTVEGFGIVVLEANARRAPVIASSGVPLGAVADGRNGLRYQFGNIQALAQAMIRIVSDDNLYAELADRSISFAQLFEFRSVCSQYERVLLDTVAGRPSRARRLPASGGRQH
jgi:glycosyltransferase involved in cell wall biosynthesis